MLISEEVLQKYKKYLTDLDYPFAKENADHEIHNIFESDYRVFLLRWIITKFIPAYSNKIEEAKKNNKLEQFLASIIYENGFCRMCEKDSFVKGTLDTDTQIIIFDRIFNILSLTYKNTISNDDSKENITQIDNSLKQIFMKPSKDNFNSNIIQDVTLIPTLGLSSKMNENEKKNKMNYYREEIKKYEEMLEKMELKEEKVGNEENNEETSVIIEKIEKLTSKFIENTNDFKVDDFITVTENNEENTSNHLDLEDSVEKNAQIINVLIKTLQKKCHLNEIMNEKSLEHDDDDDGIHGNDYFACVLQSYAMSDNILQDINRNVDD